VYPRRESTRGRCQSFHYTWIKNFSGDKLFIKGERERNEANVSLLTHESIILFQNRLINDMYETLMNLEL